MNPKLNDDCTFINHNEVLKALATPSKHDQIIKKLLSNESKLPCYALGINEHSEKLPDIIKLDGFIDDYIEQRSFWNNIPILRTNQVPKHSIVINCSLSVYPITAESKTLKNPELITINLYEILFALNKEELLPDFIKDARRDLKEKNEKYKNLFKQLSDPTSRETLNKLLAYRLTGDINYMRGFTVRVNDQYFEPFLGDMTHACFADCGGYDGDTTEEFIKRYPNYKHVYFFEPSKKNLIKAQARLIKSKRITYYPFALSNRREQLSFEDNCGAASAISAEGEKKVTATTLDQEISDEINFIKMDLEGWEINAIKGAKEHIKRNKPTLAIAVYHHISDFWKIPELILSMQNSYDVYIRHYTEGWSETVMYFIPK